MIDCKKFISQKNLDILEKRDSGMTYIKIANLYNLSSARIMQICKQTKKIIEYWEVKGKILNENSIEVVLPARFYNKNSSMMNHLNIKYIEDFCNFSEFELLRHRNFGISDLNKLKKILTNRNLFLSDSKMNFTLVLSIKAKHLKDIFNFCNERDIEIKSQKAKNYLKYLKTKDTL